MEKKRLLCLGFIFTFLFSFSGAFNAETAEGKTVNPSAEKIKLKLSTHGPPTGEHEQIWKAWANMVGEKSGGRVTVDCYFGGALAKAADANAAVKTGVVDIGFVTNTEIASQVPLSMLLETPILGFTDSRMATYVFNELINNNPAVAKEYESVKVLVAWMTNPRSIHMVKKEVHVPGDLEGTKVLAWGKVAKAVEMMGAVPVQQSPADWYTSLDRGLIEGAVTAAFLINMFKVAPLMTTHTLDLDLGYACLTLVMNQKSWNSLPEDVKSLIDNELSPWMVEELLKVDKGMQLGIPAGWKKQGHTLIHPTAEQLKAWRDAIMPLHESLIADYEKKGLPGQELYDSIQKMIKEYGK